MGSRWHQDPEQPSFALLAVQ
uniref:Uncharacterized protein n=1 Tax=Anguilla anguilla TaxID=7936 RepID=A0A0E9QZQ4_ANGAN